MGLPQSAYFANIRKDCALTWRAGAIKMPDTPFTVSGYLDDTGSIGDEITGMIDEVRIYNRALSAEKIQTIYSEENQVAHPIAR